MEPTQHTAAAQGVAGPAEPDSGDALPERYTRRGLIGIGGNATVHRVYDAHLQRELAMKIIAPDPGWSAERLERVRAEAILTARLQHPGVVPVHDCGALPDGRVWFTMKEVVGLTLAAAIRAHHAGEVGALSDRALLSRYVQVCQTVAFAHSRGVVHRDLKPDNILLGEYGEVLVVDWGLALPVEEERRGQAARVEGTPQYMAPEQARGEPGALRPPVDVYALGCVLYTILAGHGPYPSAATLGLSAVLAGPPVALRPSETRPAALITLCARAMSAEPAARGDAEALARGVQGWLDGEARRAAALEVVAEADQLQPRIASLRAESEGLRSCALALLADTPPHAPAEDKGPAWDLEDAAEARAEEAHHAEIRWLQQLRGALNLAPELLEAHARLADHYRAELARAEARRDRLAAATSALLLREHDRGAHAAFLDGAGRIALATDPPGAEVLALRYVERRRRLVAEPLGSWGSTPMLRQDVAPGSYLLRLRLEGHAEVLYPVHLERQGCWEPELPVPLPPAGALGPQDRYVPGGLFLAGGDPEAGDALERQRVWVDGFVIKASPVTHQQYLDFLNDRVARGRDEDAARWQPMFTRLAGDPGSLSAVYPRDARGRYGLGVNAQGAALEPDWPVTSVDWHGARAYAAWRAERDGLPWRLPDELEREKAARGVDGRAFPWGDRFDPSFARVAQSVSGPPRPCAVTGHPIDLSVYGVAGLAGNTRDWCGNLWTRAGPVDPATGRLTLRAVEPEATDFLATRGGAFHGRASSSRAATRYGAPPGSRLDSLGLRLTRSWPGGG